MLLLLFILLFVCICVCVVHMPWPKHVEVRKLEQFPRESVLVFYHVGPRSQTHFPRLICQTRLLTESSHQPIFTFLKIVPKQKNPETKPLFIYIGDKPDRWVRAKRKTATVDLRCSLRAFWTLVWTEAGNMFAYSNIT